MNAQTPLQEQVPPKGLISNLSISAKLGIGFGMLVSLIFFIAVVSYYSNNQATSQIQRTDDVRVPIALKASEAQVSLLLMLADVRGYLALADPESRDYYEQLYQESSRNFETDLAELQEYTVDTLGPDGKARIEELQEIHSRWKPLVRELFELRDDQLDREPAYALLATEGVEYAGNVIIDVNTMISQQGRREASDENLSIMADMSRFQGSFSAMLSALRGYTTTRNRIYRYEYEGNLADNQNAWNRLISQKNQMTASQQTLLDNINKNRQAFIEMPDEIFSILESDQWRLDLYLFTKDAVPLADQMNQSLNDLVQDQQTKLTSDLSSGRNALDLASQVIFGSGIVALLFGLLMATVSRSLIALPIRRLTNVAEQIRGGALDTQAKVESRDEIGVLASTFNNMTGKLRQTLTQVRKEKKRADDLLEVVIPIGVDLTTEKDFNRLLEKMLLEAKNFCRADTGILYLNTQGKNMEFVIVHSDANNLALGGTTGKEIGYASLPLKNTSDEPNLSNVVTSVALSGTTLNFNQPEQIEKYDLWGDDEKNQSWHDYAVNSMLTMPLKNSEEQVLGVLQLINAKDPDSGEDSLFDDNIQQMMESFSSLAVAALEAYTREFKLKQEIQQLRIEIDEVKQRQQVEEIVDTDFFQDLTKRAKEMRKRREDSEGSA